MSDLEPFLNIGMTFALFHVWGIDLETKLLLNTLVKPSTIAVPDSGIIVVEILSRPTALFALIFPRHFVMLLMSSSNIEQVGEVTL